MLKKIVIILFIVLLAAVLGVCVHRFLTTPRQEGIAHLRPAKLNPFDLEYCHLTRVVYEKSKPADLIDLPENLKDCSTDLSYYSLIIGKHKVISVVRRNPSGKFNVWIDTNLDSHLSDEKMLTTGIQKKHTYSHREEIYYHLGEIRLFGNDFSSEPFHFLCSQHGYIYIKPAVCMTGKIRIGEQIYRVTMVDGDYDGQFQTLYGQSDIFWYWNCDALIIDNETGLIPKGYDSETIFPLGKYYKFTRKLFGQNMPSDGSPAECYYSIDVCPKKTSLEMKFCEPAMGTLKVGNNRRLETKLQSDAATQSVEFHDEIQLPAGSYQMCFGKVDYIDKDGMDYQLYADYHNAAQKGKFTITAGEATTLNPGPPFIVQSDIFKKSNGTLSIYAKLIGNEGEEYGLKLTRSKTRPTLKILNENNEAIHTGTMEYG